MLSIYTAGHLEKKKENKINLFQNSQLFYFWNNIPAQGLSKTFKLTSFFQCLLTALFLSKYWKYYSQPYRFS